MQQPVISRENKVSLGSLPTVSETKRNGRLPGIDLLRGLVMIIMALDHTRDFFHSQAFTDDPLNLQTTTPWLFFTRFITHYCAPVFVFLAGTSAYLQGRRKPKKELSGFLIKRGLWLIVVEILVISLAITFDPGYHFILLQTIWSIGISMVILGLMIRLPFAVVLTTGLLIVLGHNALDYYEASVQGNTSLWYQFLHQPSGFEIAKGHFVNVGYPFLPWAGLMMVGYCFGRLYTSLEPQKRVKMLLLLGSGLLVFFGGLRAFNDYGDAQQWSVQKDSLYTFFSFINVRKYPPSLLYMCITIGPALLFLALFDKAKGALAKIITVYGRVPFFYYVLHFFLIHLVSAVCYLLRGHPFSEGWNISPVKFLPAGDGYSLGIVYLVWISVVVALYPLCRWFANYKQRHSQWWLSYL